MTLRSQPPPAPAHTRRVATTASGTTTHAYFSAAWQDIEETVDTATSPRTTTQSIYSPFYVDDLIVRDRDVSTQTAGDVDTSFNGTGIVLTDVSGNRDIANAVAVARRLYQKVSETMFPRILMLAIITCVCAVSLLTVDAQEDASRGLARELDRYLAKDSKLQLSDRDSSFSNCFSFVLDVSSVLDRRVERGYSIVVARQGGSRALLVRYADGLPFLYVRDGFSVRYEASSNNKKLLVLKGVWPHFDYERSDKAWELGVEVGLPTTVRAFALDLSGIRRTNPESVSSVSFDRVTKSLEVKTRHLDFIAELSSQDAPRFPISRWIMRSDDGRVITVRSIETSPERISDIFLSWDAFERAGLPHEPDRADPKSPWRPLPSDPILKDEDGRVLLARFAELLPALRQPNTSATGNANGERPGLLGK
jgi:hypothetical protein